MSRALAPNLLSSKPSIVMKVLSMTRTRLWLEEDRIHKTVLLHPRPLLPALPGVEGLYDHLPHRSQAL